MTELPVAIIFDNVKFALTLIRLSLNVSLVNGELFIRQIYNSPMISKSKRCV